MGIEKKKMPLFSMSQYKLFVFDAQKATSTCNRLSNKKRAINTCYAESQ